MIAKADEEEQRTAHHCFISHSRTSSLLPVVYFNLAHLALLSLCAMSSTVLYEANRPFISSRLAWVRNVPLTQLTSGYTPKTSLLAWNLPRGFLIPLSRHKNRIPDQNKGLCLDLLYHISIEAYLSISFSSRLEMSDTSEIAFK